MEALQLQEKIREESHAKALARNASFASQQASLLQPQREERLAFERQQFDLVRTQQSERERWREAERETQVQHALQQHNALLTQRKELNTIDQDHRKTLLLQDYKAKEEGLKLEGKWEHDMDKYREQEHGRRMRELTMMSAVPVGMPMMAGVPLRRPVGAPAGQRSLGNG